jgi:peptidylprolyl isomerase
MKMWSRVVLFLAVLVCGGPAIAADAENAVYLELAFGRVAIQLLPALAPNTVARFKTLVRQGFYDGVVFHRVIDGFMAQTGDPTGTGTGGSGHKLRAEFSKEKFVRGTVGMARTADPDSADSQFFIMYAAAPDLDNKYTIIGQVQSGMEYVDKLKKGDPKSGAVTNPDKIIKMQVVADAIAAQEKLNQPTAPKK